MARKKSSQARKAKKKRPVQGNEGATGAQHLGPPSNPRAKACRGSAVSGPIPNLYWGHVSTDELRSCPRFVGLAYLSESEAPLPCPAASRYVRQDSPAWRQLHTGLLTTGLLKEALGLREPLAARVVGGRKESSHAPLLAAFQHLQQQQQQLSPPLSPGGEAAWRRRAVQALIRQQQHHHLNLHHPDAKSNSQDDDLTDAERYRRSAAALSSGGLVGVRCAWGKTQEGAALAQLLEMFPASHLHEVGLCAVPSDCPTTACRPGLPSLAASPDAIIAHHLQLPFREAEPLLSALRAVEAECLSAGEGGGHGPAVTQQQQQQQGQQQQFDQRMRSCPENASWPSQRLQRVLQEVLMRVPMVHNRAGSDDNGDGGDGGDGDGGGDSGDAGVGSVDGGSSCDDDEEESVLEDEMGEGEEEGEEEGVRGCGHGVLEAGGDGGDEGTSGCSGAGDCDRDGNDDGGGKYDTDGDDCRTGEAGAGADGSGSTSRWDFGLGAVSSTTDRDTGGDDGGGAWTRGVRGTAAVRAVNSAAGAAAASATATATEAAAAAVNSVSTPAAMTTTTAVALAATATAATVAAAAAAALNGNLLAAVLESRLPALLLCHTCCEGQRRRNSAPVSEPQHAPQRQVVAAAATTGVLLPAGSETGVLTGRGFGYGSGPGIPGVREAGAAGDACSAGGSGGAVAAGAGPSAGGPGGAVAAGTCTEASAARTAPGVFPKEGAEGEEGVDWPGAWSPEQPCAIWCSCDVTAVAAGRYGTYAAAAASAGRSSVSAACGGGGGDAADAVTANGCGGSCSCGVRDHRIDGADGATGARQREAVHVVLREVVEVKNTCPFGIRQVRRGGKGRLVSELVLSDPGPRRAVSPLWVPQLQLHMLASGCRSGLLVSRSATKGTTVFRMFRDEDYLARMMALLERFNCEFVRRGVPPPRDMFARQPDYAAFLAATARLARTAVPLTGDVPWRPPLVAGNVTAAAAMQMDGGAVYETGRGNGGVSSGPLNRDESFLRQERAR